MPSPTSAPVAVRGSPLTPSYRSSSPGISKLKAYWVCCLCKQFDWKAAVPLFTSCLKLPLATTAELDRLPQEVKKYLPSSLQRKPIRTLTGSQKQQVTHLPVPSWGFLSKNTLLDSGRKCLEGALGSMVGSFSLP